MVEEVVVVHLDKCVERSLWCGACRGGDFGLV
jgi:hypothetical protein